MKKIYNCIKILTTILSVFFVQSQNLNWVPASTTGTGSASIAFMSNSILFDGEILLDPNATLGVFYIDENEEYVCGGCLDLDNNGTCDNLATEQSGGSPSYLNGGAFSVPAWGADPGEDNGFESNEIINFFINIDGVDYLANNILFSSGNDSFVANGLVVISQIEFSSQELETCSCVDPTIVTEISNGNCIIQAPNYCGSDLNSSNFCNISGFVNVIIGTPPTLYQNEAANGFPNEVCGLNPGCTNPDAQNYDVTATSDDGSCIIQGCTNANAINYDSLATSDDGSCVILGCTCSNAINYDSTATNDDSSCVISVGCSDSSAANFSGDDCPDGTFLEENCEYSDNCNDDDDAMGQLSCQQAITFFGCEGTWNDNLISDACAESCDTCASSCEDNDDAMGQLTCQQAITFFGCEGTWNDNLISDACPESCNACDTSCEVENIQWEYDVTDGNMTIQIGAEVILLNGESLPNGSLIGAFYTNDNNQLSCAGYLPYEGEQLALPIWGSESGLDNGFAIGESITWLVKVGNQTFSTNNFDMNSSPPFTDTYTPNGFGQILSAEFTCEVSGTLGCTDQNAYNFNSDATIDDGSCYNLDWTVVPTDCNMTILINDPEVVSLDISLNGSEIPPGVTIGVFYENQDGQLVCGGSVEWTGTSTAIPAFGSESGLDNGFQVGEVFENWALLIGDQTIPMDANGATMNSSGFSPSYVCNGFGNLLSVNFEGDFVLTYGCTDETACNFDNSAIIDDGNCSYGQTYYSDSDGDGLGNPSISTVSCNEILDFVTNDDDPCPDNTENPNNSLFWYFDYDGDGLGDESFIPSVAGCNSPGPEWVDNNNDLCPVSSVNDSNGNGICDEEEVLGCTNSNAINFDPSANIDDGSCIEVVEGCTDATAFNYDELANTDDGSCIEIVEGCTDENAFNYNELANTDDGSCIEVVEGCTDENAFNYNELANTDDGSCIEIVEGCTDETAFNYDPLANTDDGSCIEVVEGCTDETAFNYNPLANTDNDSCIEVVEGCTDEAAFNYDPLANTENGSCIEIVEGCTDETAFNYNPLANTDNGSCIEIVEGCTDETAFNYNELANTDNGSCIEIVEGCTDETAFNYNELANTDNGSCIDVVEGCTDETAFNYNELANTDDSSCIEVVEGCTDETACNYDENANIDDNSCYYTDGICESCIEGIVIDNDFDDDGVCDADEVVGCQDESACNYDPNATDDCLTIADIDGFFYVGQLNGSIYYFSNDPDIWEDAQSKCETAGGNLVIIESEEENNYIFQSLVNTGIVNDDTDNYNTWIGLSSQDGVFTWVNNELLGDNDFSNFYPDVENDGNFVHLTDGNNVDCDESLEYFCGGWDTQDIDMSYYFLEIINPSCCTYVPEGEPCAGCTDESAFNYNPEAVDDDGSCIPFVYGCTDENACNFSGDANTDDGSCIAITTWYLDEDGDGLGFDSGGFFEIISCDEPSDDIFNYVDNGDDLSEGDYDNDGVYTADDCDDTNENVGTAESGYNCNGQCLLDEDEDGICNEFEVPGCTDTSACNYDLSATDDDDSCTYAEEFYNCDGVCLSDIDLDGVCDELEVFGCTDDVACNFNTQATEDDNSCFYIDGICQTCENNQIVDNDEDGDGVCNDDEIAGCTDDSACNFDSLATDDDGSCFYTDGICQTCENGQIIENDDDGDGVCNYDEILGCTDDSACNFDSLATDDDGSCFYTDGICETCENGQIVDNDEDGDGVCNDDEIPGCTDPNACNFDPELGCTDDDGSCFYSEITAEIIVIDTSCESLCDGEIQLDINNGQPPYTVEYILNEQSIFSGGNLNNACVGNYLILITDALNCELTISATVDFDPSNPDSDGDGVCDSDELLGCTDEAACNFQIEATENDESCYYCDGFGADIDGDGFDDCLLINADAISNGNDPIYGCDGCINDTDFDGVCDELEIVGCTDDGEQIWSVTPGYPSCTYDSSATEQCDDLDGNGIQDCCEYPTDYYLTCNGNCSDEDINNNFVIDPEEIGNGDIDGDGVCNVLEIEGCQDESACNFNILATDQGECEYADEFYDCDGCILDTDLDGVCDELEIAGCQDGLACNFDPLATDPAECFYLELTTLVDENIQNVSCPGESDGSFTISVFGGNGPYSLYISNLNGAEYNDESQDGLFVVTNVSGGSYDVFISDINTCTTFESVDVEEIDPIDIQISYLNFISCDGGNDGALTNTISGGTPPYEFNWLDGSGLIISEEQDIYNLSAGAYAVQVVDNIGCSNQTTFILSEPNTLDISDVSVTDVSCFGGNDGNVEIDIIGGTPPFTYIFTDEFGSFVNPNSLTAGSYIVYANDSNGCSVNTDFSVNEPTSINININALNSLICEDDFTTITADEGFESYQWYEVNTGFIFGNNTNTLNVNESGIYSVTATSLDGCEINSSTVEIIVDQEPFFEINGISDVITGNTIIYYSNQNDNVSYEWSIIPSEMGEIISGNGTNEIEIIWGLEGDAQLFLTQTTTNGCENSESIDVSISWPFNLNDENEEIDFVVFPNPFSSYTNINVSNPRLLNYSIYLYDANGKIVKSYENINTESMRLDNNFSSGIYNLKLISSEGIKQKLILID